MSGIVVKNKLLVNQIEIDGKPFEFIQNFKFSK